MLHWSLLYPQDDLGLDLGDLDIEFSDLSEGPEDTEQETEIPNVSDLELDGLSEELTDRRKPETPKRNEKTPVRNIPGSSDRELESTNLDAFEKKLQAKNISGNSDKELELTDLDIFEEQLPQPTKDNAFSVEGIDPDLIIEESVKAMEGQDSSQVSPEIFHVGPDEKKLLELAKYVEEKIPAKEWNEIAAQKQTDHYIVQKGDWLWKISKKFFGSGFYYSKIWSLNPQITNPHEIEPGMTLVFTTGDTDEMPNVQLGTFQEDSAVNQSSSNFRVFGDGKAPSWLVERKKLLKQGAYFQYSSMDTYQDLLDAEKALLINEYKIYNPILPTSIQNQTQEASLKSFEKIYNLEKFSEERFLNTFITTNIVQDLGLIDSFRAEGLYASDHQYVYVKFDEAAYVTKGSLFSIYEPQGLVKHRISDREGFRYTIKAHIKVNKKVHGLWECQVIGVSSFVSRQDRVTIYVPALVTSPNTYVKRSIEAAIIATYKGSSIVSQGDIVYLDRGRKDGVEMGTIFSVYDFFDRGTKKRISPNPVYSIGTLKALNVTENFSTAYALRISDHVELGHLAFTMSEEARLKKLANKRQNAPKSRPEGFDVKLNIGDLSGDLLKEAHNIQLSDDELDELESQERKASVLKEHERDLQELAKLEKDVSDSEAAANALKVDEDKFLEQTDLETLERKDPKNPNAFEDINEIEQEVGRKYMDENLNSQENPYGLTEFDLEEIDELLNTESL